LEEVNGEMLIGYVRSRTRFRAKSTVAGVVSKLRCFGEYLVQQGKWAQNPMRWVRGPRADARGKLPRRIGAEHLRQLWEAAPRQRGSYCQQLSVAVLALLYGTGMRRGELERLNLQDWKREENLLAIDGRKTGSERRVPVIEGIGRCLEAYLPLRHNLLERRGTLGEKALLINREGKRLSAHSLGLLVHRLARKAKVPLVSLHQFRHTCASDLLEKGASLLEVKDILGHKSVQSTSRYLHIAGPERAAAISKHPLNDYLPAQRGKEQGNTP
jgi:site-specific recombinase XerD